MPGHPLTTERETAADAPPGTDVAERPVRPAGRGPVGVVALASAIGAVALAPAPTASGPADVVVTAAFAIAVVAVASAARPWAWLVAALVACAGATVGPLAVALGAALGAVAARRSPDRFPARVVGAVIGAALVQVLLRMPTDLTARNLLIAAIVVGILAISARPRADAPRRRRARHVAIMVGVAVGVAGIGFGLALLLARQDVQRGIDRADGGLDAARDGQGDDAALLLDDASRSFARAHDQLDAWWTRPAHWVPGLGPHARALEVLAEEGAQLASASARSARVARIDDLEVTDGRLDLAHVRSLRAPLADVEVALTSAATGVARAESPWLIAPIADRIAAFEDDIAAASDEARTASQAVEVLPALLGGEGERRYFVAFGTPAEARDLGGFMGAYAILGADDGDLSLRSTGRVRNLNLRFRGGELTDPTQFSDRFQAMLPERFWQNVTGTPDFPTTAEALRQLWRPPARPLDGVLYLDPQALATMLELTGPVRLEGYDTPLTAATAADFLERIQYVEFPEDDRHDFLVDAATTVFERLTSGELPPPNEVADALAPAVRQRRLLFHSFVPAEQELFERLEADGSLPPVEGDFLSVRASNRGRSKIDAFMQRTITYAVRVDPASGQVRSTVTVEVDNDAPSTGLPYPVIGNHLARPTGTSSTTVAVYTPLDLVDVRMEGESIARAVHDEYGRHRYSALVDIPPGGSKTVTFELEGTVDLRSGGYHLDVVPQPLVNPDRFVFELSAPSPWVPVGRSSVSRTLWEDAEIDVSFFSFGGT